MQLPEFKYHPEPIATGAIKSSTESCDSCGKKRGYTYTSTIYSKEEVENICPWCIADGSASKKFDGLFSDPHPLAEAGISKDIITEVCTKTPGYNSWQQEEWQHHCDDACEFHGDAHKEELISLEQDSLTEFLNKEMITLSNWEKMLEYYERGGNPAVYKFKCRHCPVIIYTMDYA